MKKYLFAPAITDRQSPLQVLQTFKVYKEISVHGSWNL